MFLISVFSQVSQCSGGRSIDYDQTSKEVLSYFFWLFMQ